MAALGHLQFADSGQRAPLTGRPEPSIDECLAAVSQSLRAAHASATSEERTAEERSSAIATMTVLRSRESDTVWWASTRVYLDAMQRSDDIARRDHRRKIDAYLASAEFVLAAQIVSDLPERLRLHAQHPFGASRRADLTLVADGIESLWPALRGELAANPGARSVDVAKTLDVSSGHLAAFSHFMAGTGALRRITEKNRVCLWYVGEHIDRDQFQLAWSWIRELR